MISEIVAVKVRKINILVNVDIEGGIYHQTLIFKVRKCWRLFGCSVQACIEEKAMFTLMADWLFH
jgi:hypothetical protein